MIDDEQLDKALDRIARTADGEMLYRFMQKTLMGTLADHNPSDGALRTEHGERRFAQRLMAKMAKGIDESGGRAGSSPTERTVVFRRSESKRVPGHVSARDHLIANDPEFQRIIAGDGTGS